MDFPDDGRGVARVDWDQDGDLDLWMANRSGPQVRFLRNDVPLKHNFLSVLLRGRGGTNRDAIGARVEVVIAGQRSPQSKLTKTLRAGDGFMAQSSKWLHFGLGECRDIERLVIHWPGGTVEEYTDVEPNRRYRIEQLSGRAEPWKAAARQVTLEPSDLMEPTTGGRSRVVSSARLPMPRLDYRTFGGKNVEVRHHASTTGDSPLLLINLWASWCVPCLSELNEWTEREKDLRAAGLDVIALAVDELDTSGPTSAQAARTIAERIDFPFNSGTATAATLEKLQMVLDHLFDLHRPLAVPASILMDSSGRVAAVYRGRVALDQLLKDVRSVTDSPDQFSTSARFAGRWYMRRKRLSPFDLAWKMVEQAALHEQTTLDDAIEYIEENRQLLNDHFHLHKLLVLVGNGRLARGEADQAAAFYREALRINVDYGEAQNNLAWLLATHADENIRDEQDAVRYAEMAVAAAGDDPPLLDTLAAAYAANGRFEEAIKTAKKAIQLATDRAQPRLAQRIERRLRLYEAGQPYRENP